MHFQTNIKSALYNNGPEDERYCEKEAYTLSPIHFRRRKFAIMVLVLVCS